MKFKSYRLWVWWKGSPVKIKLTAENTESNSVVFHHVERTDEGWSSETYFYWLETEFDYRRGSKSSVHSVVHTDGKDCDGRFSSTTSWSCPINKLAFYEREGVKWPEWKEESRKQRDYSAEAANY